MAWTAINACGPSKKVLNDETAMAKPAAVVDRPAASACKFRANILEAAEQLVHDLPKKRKRAATIKQPTAKKARTSATLSDKATRSSRRNAKANTDGENVFNEGPTEIYEDRPTITPSPKSTYSMLPEWSESSSTSITSAPTYTADILVGIKTTYVETAHDCTPMHGERSCMAAKPVERVRALPGPIGAVNSSAAEPDQQSEVFSDDSSYNEDFDQSVFDDALEEIMSTPQSVFTSTPATSTSTCSDQVERHTSLTTEPLLHPNGAPFPAFMHPCLLDSVDSQSSYHKHVCFRIAEFLNLCKSMGRCRQGLVSDDIEIDLFACVKEVKFADKFGQGQGVVFADIFFPNKPPFVSTTSRIPFSSKDLVPHPNGESTEKRAIVKAVIRLHISDPPQRDMKRSTAHPTAQSTEMSSPTITREVTHIQTTSWTEISEVKKMVEHDLQARSPSKKSFKVQERHDNDSDKENWDDFSDDDLPELATLFSRR